MTRTSWGWIMREDSCGSWKVVQPIGLDHDRWGSLNLAETVADAADKDGRYAFFTPFGQKLYDVKRAAVAVLPGAGPGQLASL